MTTFGLDRDRLVGLFVLGAIAALFGLADRWIGPPSDRHAVLFAALVGLTGLAGYQLTRRRTVALTSAIVVGLWSVPHATPRSQLWVALLPAAILAFPPNHLAKTSRFTQAGLAALAIGVAVGWLTANPWTTAIAILATIAGTLLRPSVPTRQTIGALRTASVFAPAGVFVAMAGVNAGTGWFEQSTSREALELGLALGGLLVLVAMAGLGLATLLEAEDAAQINAWIGAVVSLACLVAVLPHRDVALLYASGSHAAVPIATLSVIAATRLGKPSRFQEVVPGLLVVASIVQYALF